MNAHQRRVAKRKRVVKLHWYQQRTLKLLREHMANPIRVHDSFVNSYSCTGNDRSWLDDIQAQFRGLRERQPLIIMPLSREGTERRLVTKLGKMRAVVPPLDGLELSQFKFEPMQGDLSKGWSVVDEVPQPINKENNNGKAD